MAASGSLLSLEWRDDNVVILWSSGHNQWLYLRLKPHDDCTNLVPARRHTRKGIKALGICLCPQPRVHDVYKRTGNAPYDVHGSTSGFHRVSIREPLRQGNEIVHPVYRLHDPGFCCWSLRDANVQVGLDAGCAVHTHRALPRDEVGDTDG